MLFFSYENFAYLNSWIRFFYVKSMNIMYLKSYIGNHWVILRKIFHHSTIKNSLNTCFKNRFKYGMTGSVYYRKLSVVPCILSLAFFKPNHESIIKTSSEDSNTITAMNKNNDIVELVKKGKKSLERGENPNKAEIYYLQALHLALERNNQAHIAHLQDLLANLALENNQLDKAELLFRKVLQNLISDGMSPNDPAIIEISLKLASIYAQTGKNDLAINGYEWSAETCRSNLQKMEEKKLSTTDNDYINSKALLGMILDSYGRYLHDIYDNKSALTCTKEALEISLELFGEQDIRTLVLYNDISSILTDLEDYESAYDFLMKAVTLCNKLPDLANASEKSVVYTNLAYLYFKEAKYEEAEKVFKQALLEASKTNDDKLKKHVASFIHIISKHDREKS